ncbi:BA14K family protein [Rhizobium sp. 9140]|uniref:BA14K family protein n=1 Tax=Rhizobium sp. 9140 TaxID=1761900 RepID=UPI00079B6772|nr:BA14K family protein [Rhizobium sp. 9140]CZT33278.1 BA14K-like protein [Rhizobium sp. 9140]
MKATTALAFFLTVAMTLFIAGFLSASALMAKPATEALANINVPDLWTSEPKRVVAAEQGLERAPAAPPVDLASSDSLAVHQPVVAPPVASMDNASAEIDKTEPGAPVGETDLAMAQDEIANNPEHQAWCERRYRSYSAADNSYSAYSGERRTCISPYMDVASTNDIGRMSAPSDLATDDHVRQCQERYSSYRASDNTYQPYSGPRRACVID